MTKKMTKKRQVSMFMPEDLISEVARISEERQISKGAVYRMMVDLGIDCHKDLEKTGIIKVIDFGNFVKQSLKKRTSNMRGPGQLSLF